MTSPTLELVASRIHLSAGLNRALHDYLDTTLDFGVDQLLEVYEESETGTLPVRG